jgi:hypothetical protein
VTKNRLQIFFGQMDFLELTDIFEKSIEEDFELELLELHYIPYAFGSGTKAYRINGRNIKIIFDGRDGLLETLISGRQEKYNSSNWTTTFNGTTTDFIDKEIEKLKSKLKSV